MTQKIIIFNIRKNYPNLNTAFGSLELDIDSYSSAESDRKELLERFKENYYRSAQRRLIFIT